MTTTNTTLRQHYAGQIAASIAGSVYTNDTTHRAIASVAEEAGQTNICDTVAMMALALADSLIELEAKTRKETE